MYITSISPSSYNTSLDCPMKYYIGNVLRIREDTNMAAYKGTMAHLFFEVLASVKKAFDAKEKSVTIKGFREVEVVDPYSLNVDELFEEIYNKFVQDNNLDFDSKDKEDCRFHINAVLGSDEDPRGLKIISTEHKFSVDLEYEWAYFLDLEGNPSYLKINGVIDLVTELDEKTLKFIDWKGLPIETPIPIPGGWKTMGDLRVGDLVFDKDGKQVKVIGKSKQKFKPCYKITFDDTSEAICDDEHIWYLDNGESVSIKNLKLNDKIPVSKPLKLQKADLPIDPYVLGVWLGDGRNRGGSISGEDDFIFDKISKKGYKLGDNISSKKCQERTIFGLVKNLKELNLIHNKHIPDIYLRSSIDQRTELLQGLMDSDGNANTIRKQAIFTSCNPRLSNDVKELLLSLGQRVLQSHVKHLYKDDYVDVYPLSFRPININPFSLPRKKDKIDKKWGSGKSAVRRVTSIEQIENKVTQCIKVDSSSNTFLCTKNMIPTHNTGQRKDWIKGTRKEYADMADDIQLHIYDMVLRKLYPQYENFHVCIVWTKDGGAYDFVFSPQSAERTLAKIRERYESIRDSLVPRLNRTWKCKKFCTYGQESLPDAPIEYRRNQLNDIGQPMCMCSHLHDAIKKEGIVAVTEKYKKKKEVINDESVDMGTSEQSGT